MKVRFLFLPDHKHRDLPSMALIGYFLRQLGHSVKFSALWAEDQVINNFDPNYIIMNKFNYPPKKLLKWTKAGRKRIIIMSEGNTQGVEDNKISNRDIKSLKDSSPHLFFFWNEKRMKVISPYTDNYCVNKVVGCQRLDFHHSLFRNIFEKRNNILINYGLSPQNKTITIATSIGLSHQTDEFKKMAEDGYGDDSSKIENFRTNDKNQKLLRPITEEIIFYISKKFQNINLIVKPHPNESIIHWRNFVKSLNDDNVFLCVGENINNVLKVSDFHIAHNVCNTIIESQLLGIPTVQIITDISREFYEKDHIDIAENNVTNINEFIKIIENSNISKKENNSTNYTISKDMIFYVKKYYHRFDGLRCYKYAKEISQFVTNTQNNDLFIDNMKYFYSQISYRVLYNISHFNKKYIGRMKVDNIKKIPQKLKELAKNIDKKESKLDHRGRYDNRMKLGDELYWFEKFDKAQFDVNDFEKIYNKLYFESDDINHC